VEWILTFVRMTDDAAVSAIDSRAGLSAGMPDPA
jgi:hypothetical protein